VDDPTVYTKPWTIEIPLTKTDEPIYEYACHEGNYGLADILAGARAEEKKAAEHGADRNDPPSWFGIIHLDVCFSPRARMKVSSSPEAAYCELRLFPPFPHGLKPLQE